VSRRVSLPGADELFRTTGGRALQPSSPRQHVNGESAAPGVSAQPSAERTLRPVPDADDGLDPEPDDAHPPEVQDAAEPAEQGARAAERPAPGTGGSVPSARPVPEQTVRRPSPPKPPQVAPAGGPAAAPQQPRRKAPRPNRRPSGRERHDEKITVYVSAEELMDLEHARLVLRGEHGLAVDRGRIVREAVAVVLADLESRGEASILVRRLRGR
jgi:hypothetical protein